MKQLENIILWHYQYGSKYDKIKCTTIPYWSEQCGEVFYDKEELNEVYERFINKLDTYEPRKYILENLTEYSEVSDRLEEKALGWKDEISQRARQIDQKKIPLLIAKYSSER